MKHDRDIIYLYIPKIYAKAIFLLGLVTTLDIALTNNQTNWPVNQLTAMIFNNVVLGNKVENGPRAVFTGVHFSVEANVIFPSR